MEHRIDELESRVAFQEHTINELNEALIQQQRQIDTLTLELQTLKDRFKSMAPSNIRPVAEETPPPHY